MSDHKMIWEKWCDCYFLQLLDKSLNRISNHRKQFDEMNEAEVHAWLQKINFNFAPAKFRVKIPPVEKFCKNMQP